MPRLRTIALSTVVCFASFGLCAGLSWRWLLREALIVNSGRQPTLAEVLRPRGTELGAVLWGLAFLPVTWGGLLTFLSPIVLEPFGHGDADPARIGALFFPWLVVVALCGLMRFLYARASVPRGEAQAYPSDATGVDRQAWARHVKVTLGCGLPGLVLCAIALWTNDEFALLAALFVVPALFAPLIGALSALPVLARGLYPTGRAEVPLAPASWPRLALVLLAALALGALWVLAARDIVAPPRHAPLLERSDFAPEEVCGDGTLPPSPNDLDPTPPETLRALLAAAGVPCPDAGRMGDLWLGDQRLSWCAPSPPAPAVFVALERDSRGVVATRRLSLDSDVLVPTLDGVVAATTEPSGDLRVVRIGRDAAIDAEWRAPAPGHAWSTLQQVATGIVVAWGIGRDRFGVVELGADLSPKARPVVVHAPGQRAGWVTGADHLCVSVHGRDFLTLVLDRHRRIWQPGVADRIAGRSWSVFHLGWTAALFALFAFLSARAFHAKHRLARCAVRGEVCEGSLVVAGTGAHLHRADGNVVRLRTEDAARLGFEHGELVDGPCVLVGARPETAGAAYREAPAEIDASRCFGIVRGDLAHARAWAAAQQHRVLETAVIVATLVAGPVLALLFVPWN